jgi:hypothetical protein
MLNVRSEKTRTMGARVLQFSVRQFRAEGVLGAPLAAPGAELVERFDDDRAGSENLLTVVAWVEARAVLVVSQRVAPGPESGFQPGVHVTKGGVLFIGAGERLLAYDLHCPRRLWEDRAQVGFWGWTAHADVVLMSAELEFAAWSTRGEKLWTTFVEPPWDFTITGDEVVLDVMGTTRRFALKTGP